MSFAEIWPFIITALGIAGGFIWGIKNTKVQKVREVMTYVHEAIGALVLSEEESKKGPGRGQDKMAAVVSKGMSQLVSERGVIEKAYGRPLEDVVNDVANTQVGKLHLATKAEVADPLGGRAA